MNTVLGTEKHPQLKLPSVTLCAVTSVNVKATVYAMRKCMQQIRFAECKLLTHHSSLESCHDINVVKIPHIKSSECYSKFILTDLLDHITTSHCLIVQWDGFVIDAARWDPRFLEFDYVGASWPQFDDGFNVGNGGFSLRSRRLLEACRNPSFTQGHPEDVVIGRNNRPFLESLGLRFADHAAADRFSAERAGDISCSFGFHGVFNMIGVAGAEAFWDIYQSLDERTIVSRDRWKIARELLASNWGAAKAARLILDGL